VTPFILEYGQEQPWIYAPAALPVYDGYARIKTRGHWQTDVLAGLAIGTAAGWYSHGRIQLWKSYFQQAMKLYKPW